MNFFKSYWASLVNIVLVLINISCIIILVPTMFNVIIWRGHSDYSKSYEDALHAAVSLGRLDLVSILLTIIGVLLALFAFMSFGYFKYRAEEVAITVARETAGKVAREATLKIKKNMDSNPLNTDKSTIDKVDQYPRNLSDNNERGFDSEDESGE